MSMDRDLTTENDDTKSQFAKLQWDTTSYPLDGLKSERFKHQVQISYIAGKIVKFVEPLWKTHLEDSDGTKHRLRSNSPLKYPK